MSPWTQLVCIDLKVPEGLSCSYSMLTSASSCYIEGMLGHGPSRWLQWSLRHAEPYRYGGLVRGQEATYLEFFKILMMGND